jgi:catechol 2,3-dioxygenase-like lactoylglutathione lyase family enzyme
MFRLALQVSNLKRGVAFYSKLLGLRGRPIHGGRHYFDSGSVILALVDASGSRSKARPIPDYVYFSVRSIRRVHARARRLRCLSPEDVHGERGGDVVTRPWGERSFYAADPFGNRLCFVEAGTEFRGRRGRAAGGR